MKKIHTLIVALAGGTACALGIYRRRRNYFHAIRLERQREAYELAVLEGEGGLVFA